MSIEVLVLSAGIANYILGWIWYTAFSKSWMHEFKIDEKSFNRKDPKPYLIAFIGSLWSSYGVFLLLKYVNPQNVTELITMAVGTWLLLLVGFAWKHYAFVRRSLKAFMIDYGLNLLGLLLMSFIIW